MTFEEAQAQADSFNSSLGAETANVLYKVFAYWGGAWNKIYNVVLIPTKYETDFNAASDSQKIAFQRVAFKSISELASSTFYIEKFDAEAANDAELAAYLGL